MSKKLRIKMNAKALLMAVVFATGLSLTSCEKDDDPKKPEINNLEIGHDNNKIAYIGADLHIEADIIAEGKIDKINVDIHPEEGNGEEIEIVYDEFSGMKNTTFHKHIDIPSTIVAGKYHFHITVTDLEGNSTTTEEEITIDELVDDEAPVLTVSSKPETEKVFKTGEKITLTGNITDNTKLGGMFVALVFESDNIADADVNGANKKVIVMLHTHDFEDPDEIDFAAEIEVGATNDNNITPAVIEGENAWKSGKYYVLLRCKDVKGNWVFSEHFPVEIEI